jgi:hypothetical protein
MICDHYKHALVELAAAGADPNPQMQAHLQVCASCRSVFENERSLFASIDSCLRSSANAEIPPSFIPTVRARFQQEVQRESPPSRGSRTLTDRLLWVPGLVAAAIILFIFTRPHRRAKLLSTDEQFVTQRAESAVAQPTTPAAAKPLQVTSPQNTPAIAKNSAGASVITHKGKSLQIESHEPEILVPPDQEILLARYAAQRGRHHQSSSVLLTETTPDQTGPLQVPLIQIAELDVRPLAPLAGDREHEQEYDLRKE